ncbi:MAG: hypothetical protein AB7O96_12765 [Pseudobdellovibrionaceae bacterium]
MRQIYSFIIGAALVSSALIACAPAKSKKQEVKGSPILVAIDGTSLKIESISNAVINHKDDWGQYAVVDIKYSINSKVYEQRLDHLVGYGTEQEKKDIDTGHSVEFLSYCAPPNCERFDMLVTLKKGQDIVGQIASRARSQHITHETIQAPYIMKIEEASQKLDLKDSAGYM